MLRRGQLYATRAVWVIRDLAICSQTINHFKIWSFGVQEKDALARLQWNALLCLQAIPPPSRYNMSVQFRVVSSLTFSFLDLVLYLPWKSLGCRCFLHPWICYFFNVFVKGNGTFLNRLVSVQDGVSCLRVATAVEHFSTVWVVVTGAKVSVCMLESGAKVR